MFYYFLLADTFNIVSIVSKWFFFRDPLTDTLVNAEFEPKYVV